MTDQSFTKDERLLTRPEFRKVMEHGRKATVDRTCTFYFLANPLGRKRLGIIASKKVGNAVARNRAKRKIREIFRRHKHLGEQAVDIVVISARKLVRLPFSVLEQKMVKVLQTTR
ncbi:MAG: ribonuclease P protein component [Nitrospinaceae bacterium]|nr:ribonuclease P protein component [Nitrospinaceae bacterium]NIR53871.1 ribonuclease P protein component [Nitrospinaceae bacterium]NIS84285.1 ribonuclease P protein component [Nitrospinaceae bacterium]NIT81092.1 ribonuclease P protein component [Nitrospinaceae bacterium]NIU43374.1 ribonuclease P protein component [Nitrospinaceae bacterium]